MGDDLYVKFVPNQVSKPAFLVSYKKRLVELVISRFDYCLSWCLLSFYVLSKLRGHLCIKTSCGCSCWGFLVVGGSRPGIKWQQTKYDSSTTSRVTWTFQLKLHAWHSMYSFMILFIEKTCFKSNKCFGKNCFVTYLVSYISKQEAWSEKNQVTLVVAF